MLLHKRLYIFLAKLLIPTLNFDFSQPSTSAPLPLKIQGKFALRQTFPSGLSENHRAGRQRDLSSHQAQPCASHFFVYYKTYEPKVNLSFKFAVLIATFQKEFLV
jgi:hypothetical protein